MESIWKVPVGTQSKEHYSKVVDEVSTKARLTDSEKEIFGVVVDSVGRDVTTNKITKYLDGKISELLNVKRKIKKYK